MLRLQALPCLTVDEVAEIRTKLQASGLPWRRVSECEFALGASSYLATDVAAYRSTASETNQVLLQRFEWLYQRLLTVLTPVLRGVCPADVAYSMEFGVPGFVLLADGQKRRRWLGAHCDYNVFRSVPWNPPLKGGSLDHHASFTVAIDVPSGGAGLLYWDELSLDRIIDTARTRGIKIEQAAAALARELPARFFAYEVGVLAIHSGQVLHDVAPWEGAGRRLTLQGHALVHAGRWNVFW